MSVDTENTNYREPTFEGAGREYCDDLHGWGPGIRNHYVIHYILKGKGYLECGNGKYCVGAGQSFIIIPGLLTHYYPDKSDPWEYTWVVFHGSSAKSIISYTGFSEKSPVSPILNGNFASLFDAATRYKDNVILHDKYASVGKLYLILSEYIRLFPSQALSSQTLSYAEMAKEYIDRNYHRFSLSVAGIAEKYNINRASLYRSFIRTYGISPTKYIVNVRLETAKSLLSHTELPIKSVAYSVGYTEQLYFTKSFHEKYGMSPCKFRRNLSEHSSNNETLE